MSGADERGGSGPWSALAIHATVYVAVNALLIASWVLFGGGSASQLGSVLTSLDAARVQGFWPMYVMVFWGAALLIHLGVVVATAPARRRRRRARRRQARRRAELQASVVGALPDGVLTDAAVAGIRLTDGEKAARKVQRAAARQGGSSRPTAGTASGGGRRRDGKGRGDAEGAAPSRATGSGAEDRTRKDRPPGDRARPASDGTEPATDGTEGTTATRSAAAEPVGGRTATGAPGGPDRAPGDPPATGAPPDRRPWVAVLFTDIVDSTPLNEVLGDDTWAAVLAAHRALVRDEVAAHRGQEVGTQGDGFLLRFASPDDAVRCAVAIQQRLAEQRAHDDDPVPSVRMGVHAGEAVHHDGDDLVGRVVNLASRVTDTAAADEILLTEPVADHLPADVTLVDRGLRQLKGFDRPRHLLAVVWQPAADEIDLADEHHRRSR